MSCENNCENTTFNLEEENQPDLPVEKCAYNSGAVCEITQDINCERFNESTENLVNKDNVANNSITSVVGIIPAMESIKKGKVQSNHNEMKLVNKHQAPLKNRGFIKSNDELVKNIKMHIDSHPLRTVSIYDSDSSSSSDAHFNWRETMNDTAEEESSSSASEADEGNLSISESSSPLLRQHHQGAIKKTKNNQQVQLKNDELGLDDLPPVVNMSALEINTENELFIHMGNVMGIVDRLVTVESIANVPAYDLDTALFLDNGKKALGVVFDVLGQVACPIYAIRFNSPDDVKKMGVSIGTKVYAAPHSKHTQYVFVQQLLKLRGSDASWEDDKEVPSEFADFSDDENELNSRKVNLHTKRLHQDYKHKCFELAMNKRNTLNTKYNRYLDSYRKAKAIKRIKQTQQSQQPPQPPQPLQLPVGFNPSIPPPNLLTPQYAHFLTNPPVTYLPPEFLATLANNNSSNNLHYEPLIGGYVNSNEFHYNRPPHLADNYFINNAGKDYPGPGPSHQ